jgi:hypothetical protein
MGQFLATGLALKFSIPKKEMAQTELNLDTLIQEMEKHLHFHSALYTPQEEGEYFVFRLKEDILHQELIPFLQKFYPLIYHQDNYTDFNSVLERLKLTPPDNWLALAKEKKYETFQLDPDGDLAYLDRPFGRIVSIRYESILLCMEGKIMMETYGRQFTFFQYCITKAFSEFALSGAVLIYITG